MGRRGRCRRRDEDIAPYAMRMGICHVAYSSYISLVALASHSRSPVSSSGDIFSYTSRW